MPASGRRAYSLGSDIGCRCFSFLVSVRDSLNTAAARWSRAHAAAAPNSDRCGQTAKTRDDVADKVVDATRDPTTMRLARIADQ